MGRGLRIAAREQDDVMSERDQFVAQPRNNTLGASIKLGRNGLGQRGYLRDLHALTLSASRTGRCRLPVQRLASRAGIEPDGTRAAIARTYQLGSAGLIVAGARSVSCRLLIRPPASSRSSRWTTASIALHSSRAASKL